MSTKVEYDDAVSIISTLPMVEPCPNIYCFLKLGEIINTHKSMFPSIQSSINGWTKMFMQQKISSLSKSNPLQDLANPGVAFPDIGNPNATDVKCKHYHELWKSLH